MTLNDRQEHIRQRLAARGRLHAAELARQLGVNPMTIRRDLALMERAGLLMRTHGGAVLQSPFVAELPFSEKERLRQPHKTAIAREAVLRLRPGDAVYLDTGTTALQVARALPPSLTLKIFTNNLRVAMELYGRAGVEVIVYGGSLAPRNPDLIGELAVAQVAHYRLDVAIVGADALDSARGEFYGADAGSALLSRTAQQQARRIVLVMDSSKIGKHGSAVAGRLTRAVTLITDNELVATDRRALNRTGAEIVVARPAGRTRSAA